MSDEQIVKVEHLSIHQYTWESECKGSIKLSCQSGNIELVLTPEQCAKIIDVVIDTAMSTVNQQLQAARGNLIQYMDAVSKLPAPKSEYLQEVEIIQQEQSSESADVPPVL